MARVKKIDNAILKRIQQKKERERRSYRKKPVRRRILIVCEGEKTEPNYFRSYQMKLPKGLVKLDIFGEGENTLNIVHKAIHLRDTENKLGICYDECWVVFDKDSFPSGRFNSAVFLARKEGIGCAYSNEAFELWYLLHFEFYENAMSRTMYQSLLSTHLKVRYKKNHDAIFELLQGLGNEFKAIQRAKRLAGNYEGSNPAMENPVTYVFELIQSLREFINTG